MARKLRGESDLEMWRTESVPQAWPGKLHKRSPHLLFSKEFPPQPLHNHQQSPRSQRVTDFHPTVRSWICQLPFISKIEWVLLWGKAMVSPVLKLLYDNRSLRNFWLLNERWTKLNLEWFKLPVAEARRAAWALESQIWVPSWLFLSLAVWPWKLLWEIPFQFLQWW